MRTTIIAAGSRGDVQPYIALGAGLKEAGHAVGVMASEDFRELITAHRLEFFDMGASMEGVVQGMQGMLEEGNFLKIMADMGSTAQKIAGQAAARGLEACRDSDLIVAGLGGFFVGYALAQKLGIPFAPAFLYPFTPTREFPGVLSPLPAGRLPGWLNTLSHRMVQQMMWQTFRTADNRMRREVLRLEQLPPRGPLAGMGMNGRDILYGYSAHVIPVPEDWQKCNHVTGFWTLEPSTEWKPPVDLLNFLEAGDSPVYIGFGSMSAKDPVKTADMVLQALQRSGQRGVLSSGWGGMRKDDLPASVFMTGSLPHSWLFPRMKAVVHHGGVGTTAAGLRAGVPSIVTPFFGDQPFWGRKVYELGVGPAPVPRRKLNTQRLAEAIRQVVEDRGMQEAARQLGERLRAEDGVKQAVKVLETWTGKI